MNKDNLIRATFWAFFLLLPPVTYLLSGDPFPMYLIYGVYVASVPLVFLLGWLAKNYYDQNFYVYQQARFGVFNRALTEELKQYEWRWNNG